MVGKQDGQEQSMTADNRLTFESMRAFVLAWWQSDSIHDVCTKMKMERRDASNMAAELRRRGVPMKSMKIHPCKYCKPKLLASDYARLASLATELKEQVERIRQIKDEAEKIQRKYRQVIG